MNNNELQAQEVLARESKALKELRNCSSGSYGTYHNEGDSSIFSLTLRGCDSIPVQVNQFYNLQGLGIIDGSVAKIENLDNLVNLQDLSLTHNQIAETAGLEKLTGLKFLALCDNRIREIGVVEKLNGIVELYLDANRIETIKGIEKMKNLKVLSLAENPITDISSLEALQNLEYVDLSFTKIDKNNISILKNLENLKDVYLGSTELDKSQIKDFKKKNKKIKLHACTPFQEFIKRAKDNGATIIITPSIKLLNNFPKNFQKL